MIWPLAVNTWGEEEIKSACDVIRSGRVTMGHKVLYYEREFAKYVGSTYAVAVNSGSSANLLAIAAMAADGRIKAGDEVIVPAIAWATTYSPLAQHGLRLRVVDVDPETLNATAEAIDEAITPRTVAVLWVPVLGNPAGLKEVAEVAKRRGLWLIEDTCESLGASDGNLSAGTFGHIGTYSTFFSHHASTGEGGMLVTDDRILADYARAMRAHGWARDLGPGSPIIPNYLPRQGDYCFLLPGYNVRPTEIQAAIGLVQLGHLAKFAMARISNHIAFEKLFRDLPKVTIQRCSSGSIPFGFTMIFRDPITRLRIKEALVGAGIECRLITGGCFTMHPAAKHYKYTVAGDGLINAPRAHDCGLFVGNHPVDLSEHIKRLFDIVKEIA